MNLAHSHAALILSSSLNNHLTKNTLERLVKINHKDVSVNISDLSNTIVSPSLVTFGYKSSNIN